MIQKVIKIGNSLGVTIPSRVKDSLNIKEGDEVVVEENIYDSSVVVRKKDKTSSSITPEFLDTVKRVGSRYKNALQKLANEEK